MISHLWPKHIPIYECGTNDPIGSWEQLTNLNLMGDLYGELPDELFQLPQLKYFMRQGHPRLTGTIPGGWTVGKMVHIFGCDGVKMQ